ncbi:hypothetical protein UA08_00330 [Talaromyces atroroseus]|uniref:RNase III domain-containing protein n=1 Tax=Talaromyces atroroseus TaxID=1441469 RepID=A0A225BB67_TALAT|nr:hypothetical protein UA08_00330 [Talaromyces atroroseus]OKL64155.1 hypothetical protein UA08_00330 [Talaromyces atroroseus]
MATNVTRHSMRVLSSRARSSLRPSSIPCSQRKFSSSSSCAEDQEQVEKPRWSYTPPGAKSPFSLNAIESKRPHYPVNEDKAVLDKFYISLLGKDGDKMLSENIKWLAVTHKSFDQGRRGFNDRLALLGKRIVQLQASLCLVQNPTKYKHPVPPLSPAEQKIAFNHPALAGLENLSHNSRGWVTHRNNMAKLAQKYDVVRVMRWGPRNLTSGEPQPNDLVQSGVDVVLAHTLYAIVGALALERGGVAANKFAQERILAPQGLTSA